MVGTAAKVLLTPEHRAAQLEWRSTGINNDLLILVLIIIVRITFVWYVTLPEFSPGFLLSFTHPYQLSTLRSV